MDHNDPNSAFDDSLDRAIRDALRVETDEHEVAHLQRYWQTERRRESRRRHTLQFCTAAAATIAVAAALVLLRSREHDRDVVEAPKNLPEQVVESNAVQPAPTAENVRGTHLVPAAGRPATAYEQLFLASRSRPTTSHAAANSATVDAAIQRMSANPKADATAIIASLNAKPANVENLLVRRLPKASASEQQAIVKLLSACGSPRAVSALLRVAENEVAPSGAVAAIEKIAGADGLTQAVGKTKDPTVRADLMNRLLQAGSEESLIGFLSLVRSESTRTEALAAAKGMPELPLAQFVTLLDHKDEPVRMAAAITLGYVDGPNATKLLIDRLTEQPANSPEAWIALMSCRDTVAHEFLAYATQRPQLLGYYNNARIRWAQMIQ